MHSFIKRFKNEVTEDDIHDFRVAVKRLRAYRYFLRIINQPVLKIGSNLELLYNTAGRLRDTTNKLIYLKKIKSTKSDKDSDLNELDKTSIVYLKEFKSVLDSHDEILQPVREISNQLFNRNKEIIHPELSLIFNVLLTNLDGELNKPEPEIDLHEARKLYKKLSYLLELVNEFHPTDGSIKDQKVIVSVEKLLGTWHDMQVLKLEEGNLKSINNQNIGTLEVEFGVENRDKLIKLAKEKLNKFESIPVIRN